MNSIARLREAMPILRAHVQRGNYDAIEVELAQLTPFQRQLLGIQLCLQIAWSYCRKVLLAARCGIRAGWILLQWGMFWLWLRARRINSGVLSLAAGARLKHVQKLTGRSGRRQGSASGHSPASTRK